MTLIVKTTVNTLGLARILPTLLQIGHTRLRKSHRFQKHALPSAPTVLRQHTAHRNHLGASCKASTSTPGDQASTDRRLLKVQPRFIVTRPHQPQGFLEFQVTISLSVPNERNCVLSLESTPVMIYSAIHRTTRHLPVALTGHTKIDHKGQHHRRPRTVVLHLDPGAIQHLVRLQPMVRSKHHLLRHREQRSHHHRHR